MRISTEKAFDALPYAVEIYEKLKFENYIKATREKIGIEKKQGKKVDEMTVGIDVFKFVLKNLNKVKEEVFYLLATVEDKTVDEVKEQDMMVTIKGLKDLLSNKELVELFKSAM